MKVIRLERSATFKVEQNGIDVYSFLAYHCNCLTIEQYLCQLGPFMPLALFFHHKLAENRFPQISLHQI